MQPDFHHGLLIRTARSELLARRLDSPVQVVRQRLRGPTHLGESLLLAHPVGIDCRLVVQMNAIAP